MNTDPGMRRLVVDGETFHVTARRDGHPSYHFAWVTGPNADCGFSIGEPLLFHLGDVRPVDTEMDDLRMKQEIRQFLDDIDPETGYTRDS